MPSVPVTREFVMTRTHRSIPVFLGCLLLCLQTFTITVAASTNDKLGWSFEYDDNDRVNKVIDPAGRATRMQYLTDEAHRLRKSVRTAADGTATVLEFSERGLRSRMQDGAGAVSYDYDDNDRLIRVQREGTPAVSYTYDTLDRIKYVEVGDFYRVAYRYDFLGRLAAMETPAGLINYKYLTGQGQIVRTLPNGVKTVWEYEPNGELRSITHGLASNPDSGKYRVHRRVRLSIPSRRPDRGDPGTIIHRSSRAPVRL